MGYWKGLVNWDKISRPLVALKLPKQIRQQFLMESEGVVRDTPEDWKNPSYCFVFCVKKPGEFT